MASRVEQPKGNKDSSLGLLIHFSPESTYKAPLFAWSPLPYSLSAYRPN